MFRGVSGAVAAGHKVHEVPEVFQTQLGLLLGDLLSGVGGGVSRLADVLEALPKVPVHDGPEVLSVHEAGQPVIVGHDQSAVHGVHPFDSKLHRPAAVQHAGRRVDGIDFFRCDSDLPESGKLGVGEEKIKVGHGQSSPHYRLFLLFGHFPNFHQRFHGVWVF